jgi:hypothetical protein
VGEQDSRAALFMIEHETCVVVLRWTKKIKFSKVSVLVYTQDKLALYLVATDENGDFCFIGNHILGEAHQKNYWIFF